MIVDASVIFLTVLCLFILAGLVVNFVSMRCRSERFFEEDRKVDIVVARYKEDIGWLDRLRPERFRRIVIYNKGGDDLKVPYPNAEVRVLPNVGRCDHTYLWHIVHEWWGEGLADSTIFLPGSSDMSHKWPLVVKTVERAVEGRGSAFVVRRMRDVREELWDFTLDEWQASAEANASANPEKRLAPCEERPFGKWYEKNFGRVRAAGVVYYGVFAVSKEDVRHRKREEYERLLRYVSGSSNPEAGHYFERAWLAVFYPVADRDITGDAE